MISISPGKITVVLILIVTVLSLASIITDVLDVSGEIDRLFGTGHEKNIPTWYSSATLLLCSGLLATIARLEGQNERQFTLYWYALSGIFLFLSIDELATIHEIATIPVRERLNTAGILYFAWVIPAAILVVVLGALFARFLLHLPRLTRRLFVAGGAVYIVGALIVESIAAFYYAAYREGTSSVVPYAKITDIEELLEMAGILIFIYALLAYLAATFKKIEIRFEGQ